MFVNMLDVLNGTDVVDTIVGQDLGRIVIAKRAFILKRNAYFTSGVLIYVESQEKTIFIPCQPESASAVVTTVKIFCKCEIEYIEEPRVVATSKSVLYCTEWKHARESFFLVDFPNGSVRLDLFNNTRGAAEQREAPELDHWRKELWKALGAEIVIEENCLTKEAEDNLIHFLSSGCATENKEALVVMLMPDPVFKDVDKIAVLSTEFFSGDRNHGAFYAPVICNARYVSDKGHYSIIYPDIDNNFDSGPAYYDIVEEANFSMIEHRQGCLANFQGLRYLVEHYKG